MNYLAVEFDGGGLVVAAYPGYALPREGDVVTDGGYELLVTRTVELHPSVGQYGGRYLMAGFDFIGCGPRIWRVVRQA